MKAPILLTLAASTAFAAPTLKARAADSCPATVDTVILSLLRPKDSVAAIGFCSDYIRPLVTVTIQELSTSVVAKTLDPLTQTVTNFITEQTTSSATSTVTPVPKTTITSVSAWGYTYVTYTEVQTSTSLTGTSTLWVKRDVPTQTPVPSFLSAFSPSEISSACSRIVTPDPSTVTASEDSVVTSTSIVTPPPVVATVDRTSLSVETDYVYSTLPQQVVTDTSYDVTVYPATIATVTSTETIATVSVSTASVIPTPACGVPVAGKNGVVPSYWLTADYPALSDNWAACERAGSVSMMCILHPHYAFYICNCLSVSIVDGFVPSEGSDYFGYDGACFN